MKPVLAFDLCVFTKPSVPCYLLLGAVLLSLQLKPLNAGENEVRALAKLFPTNMISVQRLQVGHTPEDLAFIDEMGKRFMKAIQSDASLMEQTKGGPPKTDTERAALKNVVFKKIGVNDADIERLNTLMSQVEPEPHPSGPEVTFSVSRTGEVMIFKLSEGALVDKTDLKLKSAIELLSTLKLKVDATDAELTGYSLGPGKWYDLDDKRSGKNRGIEWLGRSLPTRTGGTLPSGKRMDSEKIDAVVRFGYLEKQKQLRIWLAVFPSGASIETGDFALFSMKSISSTTKK